MSSSDLPSKSTAATSLRPEQVDALLSAVCGTNGVLRTKLEALLKDSTITGQLDSASAGRAHLEVGVTSALDLRNPAAGLSSFDRLVAEQVPGTVIGRYTLLKKLGEGGMGTVYLAEQKDPVVRQVALKLIKPGLDSQEVLARFAAERQALALMDHPHIAKVFDGGTTEEAKPHEAATRDHEREGSTLTTDSALVTGGGGRPYFVMELAHGRPLTRFCDDQKLTIRQRLELFVQVCLAVQHAHQKGIIHRDLKPSNILVGLRRKSPSSSEKEGVASSGNADGLMASATLKIIDFGVAKALHNRLTDQSLVTEFGRILGTLEYMSPEQAEFDTVDIDTRADIYSLGIILYELLVGARPLDRKAHAGKTLAELVGLVRDYEPPQPSLGIASLANAGEVAARRGADPESLQRALSGDLDWITMKAIAKERDRRYATAQELALDLERHLADEPVSAAAPSAGYRLRKFIRRNRAKVLAVGILMLTLIAGVVGTTWGWMRAIDKEREAETARDNEAALRKQANAESDRAKKAEHAAEEQADIASAVASFLADDILAAADPDRGARENKITVESAIDLAAPKLAAAFGKRPQIEAELEHTIGDAYRRLGAHAKARAHLERAHELRLSLYPPDHPKIDNSRIVLACLAIADGRFADAEKGFHEVVESVQKRAGPDDRELLTAKLNYGLALLDRGRLAEAEPLVVQAWEDGKRILGPTHRNTLIAQNNVCTLRTNQGRFAQASAIGKDLVEKSTAALGPEHPDTLRACNNLALAYRQDNKPELARPLLDETLRLRRKVLGPEHVETLNCWNNLGMCMVAQRQLDEADVEFAALLPVCKRVLGDDGALTLRVLNNTGVSLFRRKKYKEATDLFESLIEPYRRVYGEGHTGHLNALDNFLTNCDQSGQYARGAAAMNDAIRLQRVACADNPLRMASWLSRQGRFLLKLGKGAEAEPPLRECLTLRQQGNASAWDIAHTESQLGHALLLQKRYSEAELLLPEALAQLRKLAKPPVWRVALREAFERAIQLYEETDRAGQAKQLRTMMEALLNPAEAKP